MTKKIQKLKEINLQLNTIIGEFETRMFIENIENIRDRKIIDVQPKPVNKQK